MEEEKERCSISFQARRFRYLIVKPSSFKRNVLGRLTLGSRLVPNANSSQAGQDYQLSLLQLVQFVFPYTLMFEEK